LLSWTWTKETSKKV